MSRASTRVAMLLSHIQPESAAMVTPYGTAGSLTSKSADDVVIVSAVRTPIGRAKKGSFKDTHPADLLSAVLEGAVSAAGASVESVDDIIVGNVLAPGGFATQSRMAMFLAGFKEETSVTTCNRQCSSGLQAVAHVAAALKSGYIEAGIAAGVESMSKADMMGSVGDINEKVFSHDQAKNCLIPMGITSENVAHKFAISRKRQDALAVASHARALRAQKEGRFNNEIVPVKTKFTNKEGVENEIVVTKDDGPREGSTIERLGGLKPAFKQGGSTTAGNSSQVSDGAAAVFMTTRKNAHARGLPIIGSFKSFVVAGVPPEIMGIGPAAAIPILLQRAGLSVDDIDIFEINEAFASQAMYCIEFLGIPMAKVNPNGGAIALGHPLGCTGARQTATILHELRRTGGKYGVVSMCIGTGMGAAALFVAE